ncbi:MAG: iron-sulfur cluster assembly scaffold protein [Dehalococcoidia bacterium]|nr:iron-sulfur cluster assembly scaffold protein [Dehalococcoidia bacterium]
MYNPRVVDHFNNPRNVGILDGADAQASVENPVCGDLINLYIKVEDGRIKRSSFQAFGCSAAIASSSIATELIQDKTLDEALKITSDTVVGALEGLPSSKMHCAGMAADVIHKAVKNYLDKK